METNWATENLQTIRTLMERSAVYRRAFAPIMLAVGIVGLTAAILGIALKFDSFVEFAGLWLGTAAVAVTGAFLIARGQAIKDDETLWSPPTRRMVQALAPAFAVCVSINVLLLIANAGGFESVFITVSVYCYGCAIHAAGFFMPRGMKLFGWLIICLGTATLWSCYRLGQCGFTFTAPVYHAIMGFFFGVLHLAYGIYLYLTERRKNAT